MTPENQAASQGLEGSDVTFTKTPSPEIFLESRRMELDSGALGKLFGSGATALTNLAGVVLVLLIVPGVIVPFLPETAVSFSDWWKITTPIITLIFGYLFGKKP